MGVISMTGIAVAAEIIVAAFAVWGMFCAAKLLSELLFVPRKARNVPTVRPDGSETDEELMALCRAASEMWIGTGEVVIVLPEDEETRKKLEARIRALGLPGTVCGKTDRS